MGGKDGQDRGLCRQPCNGGRHTNWGVLEWNEPDTETEAAFAGVDFDGKARTVSVTVDLSGSEPQLSFTYAPVEDPTERDDPYAIIDILTGEG